MKIEVSDGEIVDKVTILKIKSERITDIYKLENINRELNTLLPLLDEIGVNEVHPLFIQLYEINSKLWEIEDAIRICERDNRFGGYFVELARSVYKTNDLRFEVKKEINLKTSSNFVEEKSYQQYN